MGDAQVMKLDSGEVAELVRLTVGHHLVVVAVQRPSAPKASSAQAPAAR